MCNAPKGFVFTEKGQARRRAGRLNLRQSWKSVGGSDLTFLEVSTDVFIVEEPAVTLFEGSDPASQEETYGAFTHSYVCNLVTSNQNRK